VCLPLLISPCTIKCRSSLMASAHPGSPGKRAINGCGGVGLSVYLLATLHKNFQTWICMKFSGKAGNGPMKR